MFNNGEAVQDHQPLVVQKLAARPAHADNRVHTLLSAITLIERTAVSFIKYQTIAFAVLFCMAITHARADEQSVKLAGMDVTVWSQDLSAPVKRPIIIFSHGFHGCATQSRFLTEAFAGAGYLVFAPNHRDATCGGGKAQWSDRPEVPFWKIGVWNQDSFRDRADDICKLIAAIKTDERFRDLVDWEHFGLAGHSLGGYTVLGLGGAWPSWKLPGVKAILALSPYTQPFVQHKSLTDLGAPVMYQGGTFDFGITPSLQKSQGAYDQSPQSKYYIEFRKAGHFAWTDLARGNHDSIILYSIAFMNHYVKGEPAESVLTQSLSDVAALRYISELGNSR